MDFVRYAIARCVGAGMVGEARTFAARRWGESSLPALIAKEAVPAGTTTGENWAAPLVAFGQAAGEFFEAVEAVSIVGQMPLRRVPFRLRTVTATEGAAAYWVKEGQPKPATRMSFTGQALPPRKLAALAVVSEELAKSSDPAAEIVIRNDMIRATADALNAAFIDPANEGVDDETPASIANGITPLPSTGDPRTDLRALIESFGGDLENAVFIGRPEVFAGLSGADYPNVGARGGELLGVPAIASSSVPETTGSPPDGDVLVLADAAGIAYATGNARVDASHQGSVVMDDDPTGEGEAALVSLWQTNSVGLLVERETNWQRMRPGSVAVLSGIEWGEAE